MQRLKHRGWLITELLLVTLGLPLLLWLALPPRYILPVLWLVAWACHRTAGKFDPQPPSAWWNLQAITLRNLRPLLLRFALCAGLLSALTAWLQPELLLSFVRSNTPFWAMVMVLYPVLSVFAQEIIYRRFFFIRYRTILTSPRAMILISGIGFGLGHIVFNNWVAPTLCIIGGVLFSQTYHKTRSMALVCLEHALYGDFLFTLGIGKYFYHGAVAVH